MAEFEKAVPAGPARAEPGQHLPGGARRRGSTARRSTGCWRSTTWTDGQAQRHRPLAHRGAQQPGAAAAGSRACMHGPDDGHARRRRPGDVARRSPASIAADGHQGQPERGRARAHPAEADRRPGVQLARGGVDRAHAEVVGASRAARPAAPPRVSSGAPEEEAGRGDAARQLHREVVVAQVRAVRAGGERHVDPVVDEEGAPRRGASPRRSAARELHRLPRRLLLGAQLDGRARRPAAPPPPPPPAPGPPRSPRR